jgi:uncharacterized surface protein with fasciclin (FAS1) repeats
MPSVAAPGDIMKSLHRLGSLQAFQAAIVAAGLVPRLRGGGPFTVFAPTDEAFGRIGEHILQRWLAPEHKSQLSGILTYHVMTGRLPASEIIRMSSAPTMNGTSLTIRFAEGRMHVNNAGVVRADVECSNGLIHVIDRVVIPR